jgi:hypothetical protein
MLPQLSPQTYLRVYKPMKRCRHHRPHIHQPKILVYPEIPIFSIMNINMTSSFSIRTGVPPPLRDQAPPFSSRSGLSTPGHLPVEGLLDHASAYDQYPESSYGGTRLRGVYKHHGPAPPPIASLRDPYLGYSGTICRLTPVDTKYAWHWPWIPD